MGATATELAVQRHRRAKAQKLADALIQAGADGTEEFGPPVWRMAARIAGVSYPSELTQDVAMWIIRKATR